MWQLFQRLLANILLALRIVINLLPVHLKVFYLKLYPLRTKREALEVNPWQTVQPFFYHYVLAMTVIGYLLVYGTLGLEYQGRGGQLNWTTLPSSPYIYSHQVAPPIAWPLMDMAMMGDFLYVPTFLTLLTLTPGVKESCQLAVQRKHSMVVVVIGQSNTALSLLLSAQILRLAKIMQRTCYPAIGLFYIAANVGYLVQIYLNGAYQVSLLSVFFWLIIDPLYIFYVFYGHSIYTPISTTILAVFTPTLYIIFIARVIELRQKELLLELLHLNSRLQAAIILATKRNAPLNIYEALAAFTRHNTKRLQLCHFITEYTRYCKPFLSLLVPFFVAISSYCFYIVAFTTSDRTMKLLMTITTAECVLFLFIIIKQCAKVNDYNCHLEATSRVFAKIVQPMSAGIGKATLIKIQTQSTYRFLRPYTFQMIDHHRLTSNTFAEVFSYITVFFFFVAKQQH